MVHFNLSIKKESTKKEEFCEKVQILKGLKISKLDVSPILERLFVRVSVCVCVCVCVCEREREREREGEGEG